MSLPLSEKEASLDLYSLPVEMHCDPHGICFGETQICSNDVFGRYTQRNLESGLHEGETTAPLFL